MERRAIRDRIALDRHQAMRNMMLKGDLSEWLEHRIKDLEVSQNKKSTENRALMRNLLRGSKRKKRAIISELKSGSLRRTMSEDELGPGDEENEELELNSDDDFSEKNDLSKGEVSNLVGNNQIDKSSIHPILVDLHLSSDQRRRRHAGAENVPDLTTNLESLTVQSEFGFPSSTGGHHKRYLPSLNIGSKKKGQQKQNHNLSYYDNIYDYRQDGNKIQSSEDQELEVSDHPHLYQNTSQVFQHSDVNSSPFLSNSSRRNSIRYF